MTADVSRAAVTVGLAYIEAAGGLLTGMMSGDWTDYEDAWPRINAATGMTFAAMSGAEHELAYYGGVS